MRGNSNCPDKKYRTFLALDRVHKKSRPLYVVKCTTHGFQASFQPGGWSPEVLSIFIWPPVDVLQEALAIRHGGFDEQDQVHVQSNNGAHSFARDEDFAQARPLPGLVVADPFLPHSSTLGKSQIGDDTPVTTP